MWGHFGLRYDGLHSGLDPSSFSPANTCCMESGVSGLLGPYSGESTFSSHAGGLGRSRLTNEKRIRHDMSGGRCLFHPDCQQTKYLLFTLVSARRRAAAVEESFAMAFQNSATFQAVPATPPGRSCPWAGIVATCRATWKRSSTRGCSPSTTMSSF